MGFIGKAEKEGNKNGGISFYRESGLSGSNRLTYFRPNSMVSQRL